MDKVIESIEDKELGIKTVVGCDDKGLSRPVFMVEITIGDGNPTVFATDVTEEGILEKSNLIKAGISIACQALKCKPVLPSEDKEEVKDEKKPKKASDKDS